MALQRLNTILQSLNLRSLSDAICEGTVSVHLDCGVHYSRCNNCLEDENINLVLLSLVRISATPYSSMKQQLLLAGLPGYLLCSEHNLPDQRANLIQRWMGQLMHHGVFVHTGAIVWDRFMGLRPTNVTGDATAAAAFTNHFDWTLAAAAFGAPEAYRRDESTDGDTDFGFHTNHFGRVTAHTIHDSLQQAIFAQSLTASPTEIEDDYSNNGSDEDLDSVAASDGSEPDHGTDDTSVEDDSDCTADRLSNAMSTSSNDDDEDDDHGENEDLCPICLDPLHADGNSVESSDSSRESPSSVYATCDECNNQIHNGCMDEWIVTQYDRGHPARCPFCRALWHDQISDESSDHDDDDDDDEDDNDHDDAETQSLISNMTELDI